LNGRGNINLTTTIRCTISTNTTIFMYCGGSIDYSLIPFFLMIYLF
jgi:hypothetical protein